MVTICRTNRLVADGREYLTNQMGNLKLKRNYKSGFTLVEVLVASAIIIVAIMAISVIISRGSGLNREDMLQRRAYQAMEEVLERKDLGFRVYFQLLDSLPEEKNSSFLEDLGSVTLSDIGGQDIDATFQRRLDKVLFSYTDTTGGITNIPGIKVTVLIQYDGRQDSLSTILTAVPVD